MNITYSEPDYTPFVSEDVCQTMMETSGLRGGIDVTVRYGAVDPEDGLEFFELTYHFPSWEAAGWWMHSTFRG